MHETARLWVERQASKHGPWPAVAELGAQDVNGTVRDLFPTADYIGVDIVSGPGVDVVADAATWQPPSPVDCVVTTELLEHTPEWRHIIRNAAGILTDAGALIVTCATDPRAPHGADGGPHRDGDHYENVDPAALAAELADCFHRWIVDTSTPGDLYAVADRPRAQR